jgi:hypothetical protein
VVRARGAGERPALLVVVERSTDTQPPAIMRTRRTPVAGGDMEGGAMLITLRRAVGLEGRPSGLKLGPRQPATPTLTGSTQATPVRLRRSRASVHS